MRTVIQRGWVKFCRAAYAGAAPGGTPFGGGANTSWPAILLDLSLSASTSLRPLRLLRRTRRVLLGARGVTFAAASCAHTAAAALPRQFSSVARHGTAATAQLRLNTVVLTGFMLALIAQQVEDLASLLASLPRTMRTVAWAIKAGLSYRHFQSVHGVGREEEEYLAALSLQHIRWAEKLLHVCRTNGGIYVKAGQFASAFGVVPMEYRKTLQQLEDQAVPRSYKSVRRVLLAELGPELDSLFQEFSHESTAAASLAQVHMARLSTGEQVAVKVQYPGLENCISADLSTIGVLSRLASMMFPEVKLAWLFDELQKKLEIELDFRNEVGNAQRLARILAQSPDQPLVALPNFHLALCSKKIIVMEWIDGCKVTDVRRLKNQAINPRAVGIRLTKAFADMMFVKGYVHGDPHPGNVMVRAKGRRGFWSWLLTGSRQPFEIVLLDHGTYVDLGPELREGFAQLYCTFVLNDKKTSHALSVQLAGEKGGVILPLLLTQKARNRAEENALRAKVGVSGVSDIMAMMSSSEVPNELKDLLRISTVIRASSSSLGVSMGDRLRINGTFAKKGLPARGGGAGHINSRFDSLLYRMHLGVTLSAIRAGVWGGAVLGRAWEAVMSVCGDALFE